MQGFSTDAGVVSWCGAGTGPGRPKPSHPILAVAHPRPGALSSLRLRCSAPTHPRLLSPDSCNPSWPCPGELGRWRRRAATPTTRPLPTRSFDILFVDGGHSYEVAESDLRHFKERVTVGGILVVDDAGNDLQLPDASASSGGAPQYRGWPDVSRAVRDVIDPDARFDHVVAYKGTRVWRRTAE